MRIVMKKLDHGKEGAPLGAIVLLAAECWVAVRGLPVAWNGGRRHVELGDKVLVGILIEQQKKFSCSFGYGF
ncbi:conserved hypothetical protein [Ricinus communis]|uniref:Uncharacterized protein n=1 Tax=Ricinus communis TaxID=3988 RepID=B9RRT3_RICCO|nr:conserved hypothetical protein [Ricinus communis]